MTYYIFKLQNKIKANLLKKITSKIKNKNYLFLLLLGINAFWSRKI